MKNSFILKQRAIQQKYLNIGLECGRQQIIDMLSLVLHDNEIMGKDTFGKERLIKIINAINEYIEVYRYAWEKNVETDYWRHKMDEELARIYGKEKYDKFLTRYEFLPEFDYSKGEWKR